MDLQDKKVALLGFGLENRALLTYLKARGAIITICDRNKDLSVDRADIEYRLGSDYLKNITDFDIIFRSPGVPYLSPEIQQAKDTGVIVTSQTKLFFEKCPAKIIGVTGTKGKGTTASLIYEMLKVACQKKEIEGNVYLVGNIGVPAITILDNLKTEDWVVFELSSFQLQDLTKSPHIAVITNISEDHLDYHKNMEEYIEAKANIISHQTSSDYAVLNADLLNVLPVSKTMSSQIFVFSRHISADQIVFLEGENIVLNIPDKGRQVVSNLQDIKLFGAFNLENIYAAVITSNLTGVSIGSIKQGLKSFHGLPHRLEFVREINGIKFYDDSMATTPHSTIAAIESFTEPVTLILGGSSKGVDFTDLIKVIKKSTVKSIVCIGKEGERLIKAFANKIGDIKVIRGADNMADIVRQARDLSSPGFVVLLSPAAASFDMFKNAIDRGDQFKAAVMSL